MNYAGAARNFNMAGAQLAIAATNVAFGWVTARRGVKIALQLLVEVETEQWEPPGTLVAPSFYDPEAGELQ